ncbi:macrolide transporter ATP-binding /permease protein [Planctomycetes bacterium Poly30]|uniref:Macrolide transporter ATP-binding /permease protein n=2 Tax=Saltatorellus ferox TaxID=2528018 RepID=A0A518EZC3_9BACT|nr:macrolide transporter ATP-binding /permease protein [Planctomycetes bacterium Poly30]
MRRESRGARGRLFFMTACLALGVAAVTGVAALVAAVDGAVSRDARSLLAADVSIESRRAFPEELGPALDAFGVAEIADVVEMGAMISAPESAREPVLAELKSATSGYPLFGEIVTDPAGVTPGGLAEDELIAAPELMAQMGVGVGGSVLIGGKPYRVAAELVDEPDRVDFAMTLGPRAFVSPGGLERTGLVQFGSRVNYKRQVKIKDAATPLDAARLVTTVRESLVDAPYLRFKTFDKPSPGLTRALDRIASYLGLVALLSLLLGGIGVAQVVRAWLGSRTPAIATLRSLGFRPREVFAAYFGHVLVLSLIGCVIGIAVGLSAPFVVRAFAPELMANGAGPLQWGAALRGLVLGLGTAAVFSLPPLTAVWRVSPARVLRAEASPLPAPKVVRVLSAVALIAGVFAFAFIQTREWLPSLAFTGGLGALVLLLSGAALMVSKLASNVPRRGLGFTLRHGVAALARPGAGVIGAAVALGLGTLVVLALGIVGSRLEQELVNGAPPDAPTVFLVDVQPDQWEGVQEIMASEGMINVDSTPVVMARLSAVAGTPVHELIDDGKRGRERWTLTREQRLTWAKDLPGGNTLVEGELWSDPDAAELSIEKGFAESLGVGLGDTVSFDVQGLPMTFKITSLREVDWASFRINFFLLVEPGMMEDAPGWRLAAGRIDPEREGALQAAVVQRYPNVSVLRIRPLLEKVASTLGRIALAVRLLGGFTVLVGIAILAGAVAATSLKRGGEAALLKSMGMTRRGVASLFAVEYGLLGLVSGAFGGLGALLLSWAFLRFGLQLPGLPSLTAIPIAAVGTAALAVTAGLAASSKPLRASPIETLRG